MAESSKGLALATRNTEHQPTVAELEKKLALISSRRPRQVQDDSSDESESEEEELPPGPIDPESCLVTGPGASGGAAGSAVTFVVTAKDEAGKRITEGGDYLVATVTAKSAQAVAEAEQIAVIIKDNADGTYTGMYTVASRGNYELTVEINGKPTGGSPYPVFFSPPETKPAEAEATAMEGIVPLGLAGTPNSIAATAQAVASMLQPDLAKLTAVNQSAAAALLAAQSSIGSEARAAGVDIPSDEEVQKRTLLIGNLSKNISAEQLKQLFGFCGTVLKCDLVGKDCNYALVEYSKEQEATSALAMNKMSVMGSIIQVELTATAHAAAGAPDPVALVQARQLAQVQIMQTQHESLAAQVAQIRASARTFPGGGSSPAIPANSASQKAAALAAAAALSKRLQSLGGAPASYVPAYIKRGRAYSPPRKRPRRSKSPSPIRRRPRSPSRERARSRHASRERRSRRDSSRERRHRSARSKSRSPDRGKKDADRRRSGDRDAEQKRSRDRDADHKRSRDRDSERKQSRERNSNRKRPSKDEPERSRRRSSKEADAKPRRSRSPGKDRRREASARKDEAGDRPSQRERRSSVERSERQRDSRRSPVAEGSARRSKEGAERDGSRKQGRSEQIDRSRDRRRSASPARDGEEGRSHRRSTKAPEADATAAADDGHMDADVEHASSPRNNSSRPEVNGDAAAGAADRSPRRRRSRSPDAAAERKREKRERKQHKKDKRKRQEAEAAAQLTATAVDAPEGKLNGSAEQDRLRRMALKQFEGQKFSEGAEGAADVSADNNK